MKPKRAEVPALKVPEVPQGDVLSAAIAYAEAGWYVVPIKRGTKNPGSILGRGWQEQSSREPEQLKEWFEGSDHGIALHVGRSGAVVFDVDHPDRLHERLRPYLGGAPFQSTRTEEPGRGHYVFGVPEGRDIGNGLGGLSKGCSYYGLVTNRDTPRRSRGDEDLDHWRLNRGAFIIKY
jgi:hypothetical protein